MVYLDNSATTKPCEKSIEYINTALKDSWGNPSSLHKVGMTAEDIVNNARGVLASLIGAQKDEIFFTSCGTESNNTALFSALKRKGAGNRIITTKIEHPSVLEAAKKLENEGFEVIYLGTDKEGVIDLSELEQNLTEKTVLVSIMLVNNEIGSIQPIQQAAQIIRKKSPYALFHCDAVQGFGKMPINVKKLDLDLMSVSAHKIHGPKGIGFLYKKKGITVAPFIVGGGQEKGFRSGTESVPLIAGFMGAAEEIGNIQENYNKISDLNDYARKKIESSSFSVVNSPKESLPYIINISVPFYRSETLLHFLEMKNIFVSSGSACAKGEQSYVLSAIGLSKTYTDSALRISFSKNNTKEDIDCLFEALKEAVQKLRRSKI